MWVAQRHPMYRELDLFDENKHLRMPREVRELARESLSLNLSGVFGTAEGPEFRLEEINKGVQQLMPPISQLKDWNNVCCSYKGLQELRHVVFEDKGTLDPKCKTAVRNRPTNVCEENALRVLLREKKYLMTPYDDQKHVSLLKFWMKCLLII